MYEDFLHIEGEMLRYADPPKNQTEHIQWVKDIYWKIQQLSRGGRSPRDYVLIELKSIDDTNNTVNRKLVWRKKEKVDGNRK